MGRARVKDVSEFKLPHTGIYSSCDKFGTSVPILNFPARIHEDKIFLPYCVFKHRSLVGKPEICIARGCYHYRELSFPEESIPKKILRIDDAEMGNPDCARKKSKYKVFPFHSFPDGTKGLFYCLENRALIQSPEVCESNSCASLTKILIDEASKIF